MVYFERYAYYQKKLIEHPLDDKTSLIIVIPCYNEPDILSTLNSIVNCTPPSSLVEVIIVLNHEEDESPEIARHNIQTGKEIRSWMQNHSPDWLKIQILEEYQLPKKHAGVGLARKIGMDEAARRFQSINNEHGIIVALDADCTVAKNYILEILHHFKKYPATTGASIFFEHDLEGENSIEIINYELHLRYFINAQRWAGFPYAFQTVGSSMAVTSTVYQKVGGMPRRQAGEDFYFLHKVIPLGNFHEINSTTVYPSSRKSERVPFGTGRDIMNQMEAKESIYKTYNFESFKELKFFLKLVPSIYKVSYTKLRNDIPPPVRTFLETVDFEQKLSEIIKNTASKESFLKRFYHWFDGFMVMKYCHFLRDHFYPDLEVSSQATLLLHQFSISTLKDKKTQLLKFRELDRKR